MQQYLSNKIFKISQKLISSYEKLSFYRMQSANFRNAQIENHQNET